MEVVAVVLCSLYSQHTLQNQHWLAAIKDNGNELPAQGVIYLLSHIFHFCLERLLKTAENCYYRVLITDASYRLNNFHLTF